MSQIFGGMSKPIAGSFQMVDHDGRKSAPLPHDASMEDLDEAFAQMHRGRSGDSYTIKPRQDGRGFILEGEILSHGRLWYETESSAISFAKSLSRVKGGKIDIYNDAGELVRTEEFTPGDYAY